MSDPKLFSTSKSACPSAHLLSLSINLRIQYSFKSTQSPNPTQSPKQTQDVAYGSILQTGTEDTTNTRSHFSVLKGIVKAQEARSILGLLEEIPLDEDPDTVDGMSTQEIFVDNLELRKGNPAKGQFSARMMKSRVKLREQLRRITEPILEERIHRTFECSTKIFCDGKDGRRCTPCYSLIRRYRQGQRRSHGSHRDGHADYGRGESHGLRSGLQRWTVRRICK